MITVGWHLDWVTAYEPVARPVMMAMALVPWRWAVVMMFAVAIVTMTMT